MGEKSREGVGVGGNGVWESSRIKKVTDWRGGQVKTVKREEESGFCGREKVVKLYIHEVVRLGCGNLHLY